MDVQVGSVIVKSYKVRNKGRDSFTVSYFADGLRKQKMFADFDEAHEEAKSKAISLSKGELDVLHLTNAERLAYVHAVDAVKPTGLPLELVATEYAEAWKVHGGKASIIEAAKEFARRNLHTLPDKLSDPSNSIPGPSDVEVRLATEKSLPGPRQMVAPQEGVRLIQEPIADLKEKIAGWNRVLEQNPIDESARQCLAADSADLRDAEARLREYRLQFESQN